MRRLDNLSAAALLDLSRELRRSRRSFAPSQTLLMQERLLDRFRQIADGTAVGHRHVFVQGRSSVLCVTAGPLLVFYDADTRNVLRIVDGRRDLSRLLDDP